MHNQHQSQTNSKTNVPGCSNPDHLKTIQTKARAYRHWEDGKQWLRILPEDGMEYDEPIEGWVEVLDLTTGKLFYRKNEQTIEGL